MKNKKFVLDIQTKCGDIATEFPNAAIDAERTFKCKWPKVFYWEKLPFHNRISIVSSQYKGCYSHIFLRRHNFKNPLCIDLKKTLSIKDEELLLQDK